LQLIKQSLKALLNDWVGFCTHSRALESQHLTAGIIDAVEKDEQEQTPGEAEGTRDSIASSHFFVRWQLKVPH
jgi:hypothetical protein